VASDDGVPPDYGLVAPLALPADSHVPDPATGSSTSVEYDRYFRITRDDPGLLPWTRTCLRINGELLEDLQGSELSAEDRCRILRGLLTVQQVTLERWLAAGESAGDEPASAAEVPSAREAADRTAGDPVDDTAGDPVGDPVGERSAEGGG
jgi:hypothetical protein